MKKKILLLFVLLLLVGCGESETQPATDTTQNEVQTTDAQVEEELNIEQESTTVDELGLGETWEVPGQWTLTIDDVTLTDERNEFSDLEPAEVYIITYSYENLGYEGDIQDLYITPSRVIDETGEMGYSYPASTNTYAQPTPIGAKTVGAQEGFGVNNPSGEIKILFDLYDNENNNQKMTFVIPTK